MTEGTTRWRLVVEFDTLAVQEEADPEWSFPYDDSSRFVACLGKHWGGLPEDLLEDVDFTPARVTVVFDVLQHIEAPMAWLLAETIPVSVTLTRHEERG